MIVERTRGLQRLLTFTQAGLVSILYWALFGALGGHVFFTGHYVIYWIIVLSGLAVEMLSRDSGKITTPLYESSLVRQLPIASRQTGYALGGLFVFLAFTKDLAISRTFLVTFAIFLYPLLLWSNAMLPLRPRALAFLRRTANSPRCPARRDREPAGRVFWNFGCNGKVNLACGSPAS